MIATIRSEWLKLRTLRINVVLPIIGALFVFVVIALTTGLAPQVDTVRSSEIADIVGVSAVLAGLLISVVGVLAISSEFAHDTMRPTLVATPSRTKVIAAKVVVLTVLSAVYGLVVSVGAYVVGGAVASLRGAESFEFFAADGTSSVILVGLPLLFVMLTLFGFGLGLLLRSSPAAVALAILWPILVETIIGTTLSIGGVDDAQRFLPYQSAIALVVTDSSGSPNGRVGGALFFAVVIAVILAVATAANQRRDV